MEIKVKLVPGLSSESTLTEVLLLKRDSQLFFLFYGENDKLNTICLLECRNLTKPQRP